MMEKDKKQEDKTELQHNDDDDEDSLGESIL